MTDRNFSFHGAIAVALLASGVLVAGCADEHVTRTTTTERTTAVQPAAPAPMGTSTTTTTKQTTYP
jgi:hypothetical protein